LPVPTKRGSILSFSFFPEFEKRRLPFGCPLPFFLPPTSLSLNLFLCESRCASLRLI